MAHDLSIFLDGQGAWPELLTPRTRLAQWQGLAVLTPGPEDEDLRIALRLTTRDEEVVFATVPWAQLYAAVVAIATRYGPPLEAG
jgi:hypothetical protein